MHTNVCTNVSGWLKVVRAHERWLKSIADCFNTDFWLSNIAYDVMEAQEAFGVKHADRCCGGAVVWVPTAAGEDKGNLDFRDMLLDLSFGCD